ncbi:MAG: hypothetical protein KDC98_08730 [Planctomycetes bacterium]|nr:hypothetical protein [Planctomycetota bacterium]
MGSRLLGLLIAGHVSFGLLRLPAGSIWKRVDAIDEYERQGPVWHFRLSDDETRRLAGWILETLPADEVLLFDGGVAGQLQLLGPLAFPRLLVHVSALRPDGTALGRKVFAGQPPWLEPDVSGYPVVVGTRQTLRWERR